MASTLTPFEIPLSPQAQKFTIALLGVTYSFRVTWNVPSNCWLLDISDVNDQPIVQGIPVITGANLLDQFQYLGLGGGLLALTDSNVDAVPTFDNLGDAGHLFFVAVS